jgi:Flp pilus assembly protein TadD
VLVEQGKLDEALANYRKDVALSEALATASPSNAEWQRDLSVAYDQVGAVLVGGQNWTRH